ncbi:substance-K receptor [Hydra vulgaris]|uniref:Substance-K receptor n=1 Tax=Hydra vulgaris TaxID=6087 RepID=A0ABM4BQZ9_HYDVU
MNDSCGNFTTISKEINNVLVTTYILIIFLSIIGNCAVFTVVAANRHMRTVTNLLICNSSVADLLITFLPTTYEVLDLVKYKGVWSMGSFMCSFLYLCNYCSVSASIFTLLVLAVDRYCAIMNPFKKLVTLNMLKFIIPVIWTSSLCFASPVLFTQKVIIENNKKVCAETWPNFMSAESARHYTVVLFTCLYLIPLIIILILYSIMAIKLTSSVSMDDNSSSYRSCTVESKEEIAMENIIENNNWLDSIRKEKVEVFLRNKYIYKKKMQKRNKINVLPKKSVLRKRRVIRMLVAVVMNFAICWGPVHIIQFLSYFHPFYIQCQQALRKAAYFGYVIQYANSSINPMLYFLLSVTYRKGLRHALKLLPWVRKKEKALAVRTRKITKTSLLCSDSNICEKGT